jgi:hypothetical protein
VKRILDLIQSVQAAKECHFDPTTPVNECFQIIALVMYPARYEFLAVRCIKTRGAASWARGFRAATAMEAFP